MKKAIPLLLALVIVSLFLPALAATPSLKKPLVYEDVRGQINDGLYANEAFGFTMNVNQKNFKYELSNQEGYKYNFSHPTAIADDIVLSVYTGDFKYILWFSQSSILSHTGTSAKDILASDLSQYKPTITKKMLSGQEAAYAQLNDNGQISDYYAMIVNGYYIKWTVKYANTNTEYAKQLNDILNSLRFD